MSEGAKTITRYNCKRCSLVTEIPGSSWFGMRLPPGWKRVNQSQLCSGCARDYDREYSSFFSKFMSEGKKRK